MTQTYIGGRTWADVPPNTVAPPGTADWEAATLNALEADVRYAATEFRAGETITILKDPVTGNWPHAWTGFDGRTPVYSGGAADSMVRPTDRTDVHFLVTGPDPSPAIVMSGTGGMLSGSDFRIPTP